MKHALAATASRITAGREVSTEIGIDVERARLSMTGTTRAISAATDGGASSRTRGFTTDVEQVGTLRNEHKSVVDRGGRIDISAAIRKQVGVALTIPQTSGPCLRQATQQAIAGAHR